MNISYIPHALSQIKARGISKAEVEEVIVKGQERQLQPNDRVKCLYRNKKGKIVVIYEQRRENYKIITAYHPYED